MPDNNQFNYREQPNGAQQRRPVQSPNGAVQYRNGASPANKANGARPNGGRPNGGRPNPNRQRPNGRPNNQRPNPNRQNPNRKKRKKDSSSAISAAVKGIIAILFTLLIVVLVIMVFAKSLFNGTDTTTKKTGSITSTRYTAPSETKAATEKETTKKTAHGKQEKEEEEEEEYKETLETITCTGPVYLHPQPSSSSENLLTIQTGEEVKFIRNENGWYYIDYKGQEGYAWGNYFTAPTSTSQQQ